MGKSSEALLALNPVTFQYKNDVGAIRQFGLVAEEVATVNPELVVLDHDGKPRSVRYDAVNAMLLNEFLKEHKKVQEQQATIAELKSTVARQTNEMKEIAAQLKQQAQQIQKVTAQVEIAKPGAKVVFKNP